MARANIISIMQSKRIDAEFNYDMLTSHGKISNYLTWDDIFNLNKIATSKKLSSKLKEKYKLIDQIMVPRGFKRFASGTNRVVYKYLDDYSFVFKIAIDAVALSDNIDEMNNQVYIKPFVCKCFDVTPCGTVGMFERIDPITSKQQFLSIAEDVFDIINQKLIGKYILEDIGSKYFMNWGIRLGLKYETTYCRNTVRNYSLNCWEYVMLN